MAQLRYSSSLSIPPIPNPNRHFSIFAPPLPSISLLLHSPRSTLSLSLLQTKVSIAVSDSTGNNDGNDNGKGYGGNGKGNNNNNNNDDGNPNSDDNEPQPSNIPIIGSFINGWRSRASADPQFPFKVLMEELVGVSSCLIGDMASRPNFGLNELDFVFSTLVVGSILNFVLMYLLAPTASHSSSQNLPSIFGNSPKSHMFEPGAYSLFGRMGTFVYKGMVFAAVGFAAGLVGTAISNGLIKLRKKMDPEFETPNKPPPTVLNALTWAIHMGLSSNFRYQTLNGIEFLLAKGLPPVAFKASVVVLRCLNNVLGGVTFVLLARLTGSQKVEGSKAAVASEAVGLENEKEKLLSVKDREERDLQSSQSPSK